MKLPNFLIIGAKKSGTSSLYYYLKSHPDIFMSSIKEPAYFCYDKMNVPEYIEERYKRKINSREELLKLMLEGYKSQKMFGEASVGYTQHIFNSSSIAKQIKQQVPEMKFIYILRNPFDRIVSEYILGEHLGRHKTDLNTALRRDQSLVKVSLYYAHLREYLKHFPADRFKIFIFEEFIKDPESHLNSIFQFLGIKTIDKLPEYPHINQSTNRENFEPKDLKFSPRNYRKISKIIKQDVAEMEKYLGRSLGIWDLSKEKWCGDEAGYLRRYFNYAREYFNHVVKKLGYKRPGKTKPINTADKNLALNKIKQVGNLENFIAYPNETSPFSKKEIEFCMNVILDKFSAAEELEYLKKNKLDFSNIYRISEDLRCPVVFFHNLKNENLLPKEISKKLNFEAGLNKLRLKHFFEAIKDLNKVAAENKINFVLFKGISLARHYPELHLRKFNDIDIITKKRSAKRIFKELKSFGYKQERNNPRDYRSYKQIVGIESHYKLLHEEWFGKEMRDDYEFVSENSELVNINSYSLNMPKPEMMLYILCSHILHHLYYDNTLYKNNFIDMYYLLKSNPKLDWSRFFSLIEDEYYRACFNEILNTFSRITGLELKDKNIYIR
jgi:hypothetical protein